MIVMRERMNMSEIGHHFRGTGRTQRMVESAMEQEKAGENVFIIVARASQMDDIKRRLPKDSMITVLSSSDRRVNLDEMRINYGPSNGRGVFVDHYVWECRADESMRRLMANRQKTIKEEGTP